MSDEDQIQVMISPVHLQAGIAENIDVRLTNNGLGQCTNINFSIRPQSGLMLLKGTGKIQRNALAVGESCATSLRVIAGEPGLYRLVSPSFSYQDYRGRSRNAKVFPIEIFVGPESQAVPRPQLSAELLTKEITLGEWDLLRASVANIGEASAVEVAVTLAGKAVTTEENGPVLMSPLSPGSSQELAFHVLAREGGLHVPVRLSLAYRGPDGQPYDDQQSCSLRVGRAQAGPTGTTGTMKILFLAANPPHLPTLRIDKEAREIRHEIRSGRERDRIQIETRWAVRPPDISGELLDVEPDFVHFAGHGGGSEESFVAEGEAEQSTLVPVSGLVTLFRVLGQNVRCVLVNACSTQQLAMELSVALPHAYVIGMCEPVGDRSAVSFSVGFYQAIAAGRLVEEAFELGRAQMLMAHDNATAPALWHVGVVISTH